MVKSVFNQISEGYKLTQRKLNQSLQNFRSTRFRDLGTEDSSIIKNISNLINGLIRHGTDGNNIYVKTKEHLSSYYQQITQELKALNEIRPSSNNNPIVKYSNYTARATFLKTAANCLQENFSDQNPTVNKIVNYLINSSNENQRLADSEGAKIQNHHEANLSDGERRSINRSSRITHFFYLQNRIINQIRDIRDPNSRLEKKEGVLYLPAYDFKTAVKDGIEVINEFDPNFTMDSTRRVQQTLAKLVEQHYDKDSWENRFEVELIPVSDLAKINLEELDSSIYKKADAISEKVKPFLNKNLTGYGNVFNLYKGGEVITVKPDGNAISRYESLVKAGLAEELDEKQKLTLPWEDDFVQQVSLLKKQNQTGTYLFTVFTSPKSKAPDYIIPFTIE
ncbi:MAG: hypothetical protein HRT47_05605 [Candidatus Caenarcaniphilales bacterium]|nr:hypothetical protein [Candidatus Caenarcaniphilales bacterium]